MYFTFDGTIYEQVMGTPMGSPISGFIAEAVLQLSESLVFQHHRPKFWAGHVDDTFVFIDRDQLVTFKERLNAVFPDVQFTMEEEENNQLAFLDVLVCRKDCGGLKAKVFRKATNMMQAPNFNSNHPVSHKRSCVRTLYRRVETHCSEPEDKIAELQYLRRVFKANGYSRNFVNRCIRKMDERPNHNPRCNRLELRTAVVARELARYKADVAALSETRFSEQDQLEEVGADCTYFWSGCPKAERRDVGVAFVIRNDIVGRLPCLPQGINDRLMNFRLHFPVPKADKLIVLWGLQRPRPRRPRCLERSAGSPRSSRSSRLKRQWSAAPPHLRRTPPHPDEHVLLSAGAREGQLEASSVASVAPAGLFPGVDEWNYHRLVVSKMWIHLQLRRGPQDKRPPSNELAQRLVSLTLVATDENASMWYRLCHLRDTVQSTALAVLKVIEPQAEHFRGVLNRPSTISGVAIVRLPQVDTNADLDLPPSLHETMRDEQQLSSEKAPGSDAIPAEISKHGGPQLMDHLTMLFLKM
nr:unnamed protein product [Spirometra erinaceieuropaei]